MRKVCLISVCVAVVAFALPAARGDDSSPSRFALPGAFEMIELAPVNHSLHAPLRVEPFGLTRRSDTGFEVLPDWPILYDGNAVHGGMLVDMDGDAELELFLVVGAWARALDPDGSDVAGWPQYVGDQPFSTPAFGDIDGDGEADIVLHTFFYGIGGQLFAFHLDGTPVNGFPQELGGTVKGPTLGDMDGDGDLEILSVQNVSGTGTIFALDGDGSVLPGWPKTFDHVGASGPSFGDIDGVPGPEIVALSYHSLYVYDPEGNLLPGFPFTPGGGHTFNYNSPVLADMDRDGDREIVVCTSLESGAGGRAYVLHHDGSVATGWPRPLDYPCFIPASVVDLDGDGWLDVLTGDVVLSPTPVNSVYAWDRMGNPLDGFPITSLPAIHGQIMVADFDDDGMLEITFDGNISNSDYMGYNHDGSPMEGWPLPVAGSSFLGCLNVSDIDGDGSMDLAGTGSLIQEGKTYLYLWTSEFPYTRSRAPLPTFQYNLRRDGVADPDAIPDITANGSDGPIVVDYGTDVNVAVSLDPAFYAGASADWWLVAGSPFGWFHYGLSQRTWLPGLVATFQGPLLSIGPVQVFSGAFLPAGSYLFVFGVDLDVNGLPDLDQAFYDMVSVTVER